MGESMNIYILMGKHLVERPLGRAVGRTEANIKMDCREVACEHEVIVMVCEELKVMIKIIS
jgi:hypothetical protein